MGYTDGIYRMDDINQSELCKGCKSYWNIYKNELNCSVDPIKDNKQCPCTVCLIKGMCRESCEEFREYGSKSWGYTEWMTKE